MPSILDLKQTALDEFLPIEQTIRERKGFCSPFERTAILGLFKKHGAIKTAFVIERSMANDWLKSDRWEILMDLVEHYNIDRVLWAIKAMNKLDNHSLATVEGILNGSIPATRKPANAKNEPARPVQARPYPPSDHRFYKHEAERWLSEHDHAIANALEFFDNGGRDANNIQIYSLKSEYR